MAKWKQELNLNEILRKADDLNLEEKDEIPSELKKDIISEISKANELKSLADEVEMAETIEELNYVLEDIYMTADTHNIWCGI